MNTFRTKSKVLTGSNYHEVSKQAHDVFQVVKNKRKRKIYVRSAYFKKQKVFFDYFWPHLLEKRPPDRVRRLRLLPCAVEVIHESRCKPEEIHNIEGRKSELFYRFLGETPQGTRFIVQIKKTTLKNTLQCLSCFPIK